MASSETATCTAADTASPTTIERLETPPVFTCGPSLAKFLVTRKEYLAHSNTLSGVAVGAYVFDKAGRLLLVQRAAEDSMPLRWEIPGGGVKEKDESILHAAVRELREESRLRAQHVHELVGDGYIFTSKRSGKTIARFCFIMHVDGYDVTMNPAEHQAYLWVTEEEALAKKCGDVEIVYTTQNQESYIPKAFQLYKERMADGSDIGSQATISEVAGPVHDPAQDRDAVEVATAGENKEQDCCA
ncbi:NUDIX hydrolase domain-like protein [Xylariaceae sp. FL0594]|nr:NUDIX hydrolase domain-like protein [Xylariaceae sp. FL0594]